ncbi:hypothetical protein M8J77_002822 [Diaphorina citri]|nr:hypothetical protein M8J77_002822 [Diaphorina citri]
MGIVCCKREHPHEHTVTSLYHKPSAGGILCEEIKTQFRLCPTRRRQKIKQRRRFKKRNLKKERPIISSPKLLNPKYLTGEKWQNVILTIPDPKMKTRTPVPPPRKRRKSLINLCTKRNDSVEYVNLCACENEYCDRNIFDSKNFSENKLYSSEPDIFKKFSNAGTEQQHSNLRRSVSYEEVASLREFCRVIKTSSDNTSTRILNSYIHRCLLCYINDIMSLVEQINTTNNDEYKFKLDDTSSYDNDEYNEKEIQLREDENEREEEQQDGTVLDKETKLCEINEQKLLESLENFCIHCYLNKIQTHPKEREDISSTSTKVNENNLKSFQTDDKYQLQLSNVNKNKIENTNSKNHSRKNERNNVQSAKNPQKESKTAAIPRENVNYTLQENQRRTDEEDFKRYNTNRKMLQNLRKNIDSHRKKRSDERLHDRNKQNNSQSSILRKVQVGNVVNNTGQDRHHKQTDVVDNLTTGKSKISQESINEVDSQSLERKMNAKSENQTTCNKILKNFNNVHDPSIAERRKNKFQELMANLNSKKISCDTEAANKDKPLPKVQEHSNNNIVNNNKQEPNCENQLLFDNNGNYLDNSETSKQKSSQISLGNQIDNLTAAVEESKLSTAVNQDLTYVTPNQINDKRGFIIRNSMKRKSYKLKRNHENQPGDLESRRSSVTDSLYELEASLYEMLQNSCSLSMEDVEYV